MSGTAGLSAAKNRRSGNEVKNVGQNKQLPPPQQCSRQPTAQSGRNTTQQQTTTSSQQQNSSTPLPHPLVLLKSHELRLQKLESTPDTQHNNNKDYSSLQNDFSSFKKEYSTFKQNVESTEKGIVIAIDNITKKDRNDTSSQLETKLFDSLQKRVNDMYKIMEKFSLELSNIKNELKSKLNDCNTIVKSDEINNKVSNQTDNINSQTSNKDNNIFNKVEDQNITIELSECNVLTPK